MGGGDGSNRPVTSSTYIFSGRRHQRSLPHEHAPLQFSRHATIEDIRERSETYEIVTAPSTIWSQHLLDAAVGCKPELRAASRCIRRQPHSVVVIRNFIKATIAAAPTNLPRHVSPLLEVATHLRPSNASRRRRLALFFFFSCFSDFFSMKKIFKHLRKKKIRCCERVNTMVLLICAPSHFSFAGYYPFRVSTTSFRLKRYLSPKQHRHLKNLPK